MAKRPDDSELTFADFDAEWLNTPSPFDELDADWVKIIVFFVFHVPVKNVSARGTTLSRFHWGEKNKTDDLKQLKKRLIKYSTMQTETFKSVDLWKDLKGNLSDNDLLNFPSDVNRERITYRNDKGGINESLFNHLRNSFAHGRLSFYAIAGDTIIVLEDIDNKKTVTARLILRKSTLLKWIIVIQKGPFISDEELDRFINAT